MIRRSDDSLIRIDGLTDTRIIEIRGTGELGEVEGLKTFEDLEVWQVCRNLRILLHSMVKKFPVEEKYRLADQIIRAARSTTNALAEGYGRYHYQETIQFCRQCRGSLFELIDHLIIANDEGYLSSEDHQTIRNQIVRAIQLVNGYIRYLQTQKTKSRFHE